MALKQRARNEEDKQARRAAILEVAAHLLGRARDGGDEPKGFANITMADVARKCGLAKGTLYLYFKSKEELFLAALEEHLAGWFDELVHRLESAEEWNADAFAAMVARSLAERETLTDLMSILHGVLERNIDPETALAFKQMLRSKLVAGGEVVQSILHLPPGSGTRLLVRIHALVVGLRPMADPSPTVASVLAREDLALLRIDFESELAAAIADSIFAMQQRA